MMIIKTLATVTLSLTTAAQDITGNIPDQVGSLEGVALVFKGDHTSPVYIGPSDKSVNMPFPSGEFGELSTFRRDSMEENHSHMWADAATDCTVSFVLVQ